MKYSVTLCLNPDPFASEDLTLFVVVDQEVHMTLDLQKKNMEQVTKNQSQNPNQHGDNLHPNDPEEVQLGPAVQNLEAPLEAVQMILPSTPSPRRARSNRMLLDYRQLHNYGSRRARL